MSDIIINILLHTDGVVIREMKAKVGKVEVTFFPKSRLVHGIKTVLMTVLSTDKEKETDE